MQPGESECSFDGMNLFQDEPKWPEIGFAEMMAIAALNPSQNGNNTCALPGVISTRNDKTLDKELKLRPEARAKRKDVRSPSLSLRVTLLIVLHHKS
jgi:hypothetical protein